MELTFLGTGTSVGIPMIGCQCAVCQSEDPHNKRLRTSALLRIGEQTILIDAGPDLRQQLLTNKLQRLDAILLTHSHADHISGLDDVRPLNFAQQAPIAIYGDAHTLSNVRTRYDYAFTVTSKGSTRPQLELNQIQAYQAFKIGDIEILPLEIQHGTWDITAYRIGKLGYVTDASNIPDATMEHLQGVEVLVLNALRYAPHPTHFTIEQACEIIDRIQPKQAFLVHMNHELDHASTNAKLPASIQLAYDQQRVEIEYP
jgi:phosphoribosyl 1,2-cyclic phosphate phosphodiesterase